MTDDDPTCRIGGRAATRSEAIEAAAAVLRDSVCPLILCAEIDVAGTEAAVALARALGGIVDHVQSPAALRDLGVMRDAGWIVTSPLQARARADLVLLVGPGLDAAWPDLAERLALDAPPPLAAAGARRVLRLCPGAGARDGAQDEDTIRSTPAELPGLLATLRALAAGRRVTPAAPERAALAAWAEALRAARYGVVVWSAATLDALAIEMLCGLIDALNETTRFAGLPLAPGGGAAAAMQAAGWEAGFPLPVGFGRFHPEHDPLRLGADRLIGSGEADAVLWIGTDPGSAAAPHLEDAALIALVPEAEVQAASGAAVAIAIGRPGIDHDAVQWRAELGALAPVVASARSAAPSVAEILRALARAAAPAAEAVSC